jgi:D-alanyl-D-alanine carboxypeptidase
MPGARVFATSSVVIAAAITATACSSRAMPVSGQLVAAGALAPAVDSIVEASRSELALPGVSIAILRGHTLLVAKGYGLADRESSVPPSERTIYPIGSLSKQITAAAVMKLVEQGRIHLDEPLATYLPEYRPTSGQMPSIRQLLLQTSGIPTWDDLPDMQHIDSGNADRFTRARMIDVLAQTPVLYPAGQWWSYSNSNYFLLAAAIEHVTGMNYDEYLAEIFFGPLGLGSTGGCASEPITGAPDRAVGYGFVDGSYVPRPLSHTEAYAAVGAGGLCSNAADLVRWMRALVDGKVVSPASFRQMTTAAPVGAGFTPPYGYGLSLRPLVGQRAVWHIGVISGFMSVLAYFPDQDVIIAALANRLHAPLDVIVKRISRALMGLPAPLLRDLPVPASERDRSVGTYDDGLFTFRVYQQGEQLYVDVPPFGPPLRLRYQGAHDFATPEPDERRFRFEPADGPVKRVDWEWGEIRAFGRRIQ